MNTPANHLTSISKFLSLVLRHQPQVVGMQLDAEGWLPIDQLIENANRKGKNLSLELIHEVVSTCEKKRFALSDDGLMIRANQGHSVANVDLKLVPVTPPSYLYHGTVAAFLDGIRKKGLLKRSRHHVHLSSDVETATKVAARRGVPVILTIQSEAMHQRGFEYFLSANGVWLTDHVPPEFIQYPDVDHGYLTTANSGRLEAMASFFPQDLLHRFALGQFVDQLVQVPNLLSQRIFNLFDAITADHTFDQASIWIQFSLLKELFKSRSTFDMFLKLAFVKSCQPSNHLM